MADISAWIKFINSYVSVPSEPLLPSRGIQREELEPPRVETPYKFNDLRIFLDSGTPEIRILYIKLCNSKFLFSRISTVLQKLSPHLSDRQRSFFREHGCRDISHGPRVWDPFRVGLLKLPVVCVLKNGWLSDETMLRSAFLREAAKKRYSFSGPATKALPLPPPLELSGHRHGIFF